MAGTRRRFLLRLSAALSVGVCLPPMRELLWPAAAVAEERTGAERILEAACARMLPTIDGLPGARDVGVVDYLFRALSLPYYAEARAVLYAGAQRLERVAQRDWQHGFVTLAPADQDAALDYVQQGGSDDDAFSGEEFLDRLLELSLEGFLGDPRHGGNRDELGWQFVGVTVAGPRCPHPPEPVDEGDGR